MIKIRLVGTKDETARAIDILRKSEELRLLEVSDYYTNKDGSLLGRMYVDADILEKRKNNTH